MNKWNLDQFCLELELLLALPIDSKEQLADWDSSSEAFEEKLAVNEIEIENSEFHQIQRYLTDSDIRFKDEGYRSVQESQIREILQKYRTLRADPDGAGQPHLRASNSKAT